MRDRQHLTWGEGYVTSPLTVKIWDQWAPLLDAPTAGVHHFVVRLRGTLSWLLPAGDWARYITKARIRRSFPSPQLQRLPWLLKGARAPVSS